MQIKEILSEGLKREVEVVIGADAIAEKVDARLKEISKKVTKEKVLDDLINKVLGGLDVHTATAHQARCSRSEAKTVNFLTLYGGGVAKLASALGTTLVSVA